MEGEGPARLPSGLLPRHFDMVGEEERIISTCPAIGGYHICPSEDVDPPPSGPVYNNPLGEQRVVKLHG